MSELTNEDWVQLRDFVSKSGMVGGGPAALSEADWRPVYVVVQRLVATDARLEMVQVRKLLAPLYVQDSVTNLPLLQTLDVAAIEAGKHLALWGGVAQFLHDRGQSLARQGFHQEALEAFVQAQRYYASVGEDESAAKSHYMQALCWRALGKHQLARKQLEEVVAATDPNDPWIGEPLQALSWVERDAGRLVQAEELLRRAIAAERQGADPDILVSGALSDLGEVISLQHRWQEADAPFEEALGILHRHAGQFNREEARVLVKHAEHCTRFGDRRRALHLLDAADDLVRSPGHYYDLLWRIELGRAFVFFQSGQLSVAWRKLRSALTLQNHLGRSPRSVLRAVGRLWGR